MAAGTQLLVAGAGPLPMVVAVLLSLSCASDKEESPAEPSSPAEPAPELPVFDASTATVERALAKIVATCARASGEVEVRRKGEAHWSAVQVGATFRAGDWIRTKQNSAARVQFLASGALDLEQNTSIIVELAPASDDSKLASTMVSLESGVAHGVMNRANLASEPLLVSRGGELVRLEAKSDSVEYRLSKSEEGTEIAVTKGDLVVGQGDSILDMRSGELAVVGRGSPLRTRPMIGFPVSLTPGVDARFLYKKEAAITLRWKAVKKAKNYRLQVAEDLSFEALLVNKEIDGTQADFTPPQAGVYAWRVAAKDRQGSFGENGFTRRIFAEQAPPLELLLAPVSGTKLAYESKAPSVSFSWQSAGAAESYRLVVGKGANPLRSTVFETRVSAQVYVADTLEAGVYTWGVYVGEDDEPLFLKPWRLTIQRRKRPKGNAEGIWD